MVPGLGTGLASEMVWFNSLCGTVVLCVSVVSV